MVTNRRGDVPKDEPQELAEIRYRSEAQRTGAYLLIRGNEREAARVTYIDQSDDVSNRLAGGAGRQPAA